MYTTKNFKSKKALKDAIAAGERVTVFQPNDIRSNPTPANGEVTVEGPHYPAPHTWYATVLVEADVVRRVLR